MPRILYIGADFCGPCTQQEPIIEELESDGYDVTYYDVETDNGQDVANKYSVTSIPTTVVLDDNDDVITQFTGVTQKDDIERALDR